MLQTGLSHGVAVIPNAPKQRFTDPVTGAHFQFEDMCQRLEKVMKKRFAEQMQSSQVVINKEFMKNKGETLAKGPEEVLEENVLPLKARRMQNFIKSAQFNEEALVEIEEADEPNITLPRKQRIAIADKPANMQRDDKEAEEAHRDLGSKIAGKK